MTYDVIQSARIIILYNAKHHNKHDYFIVFETILQIDFYIY